MSPAKEEPSAGGADKGPEEGAPQPRARGRPVRSLSPDGAATCAAPRCAPAPPGAVLVSMEEGGEGEPSFGAADKGPDPQPRARGRPARSRSPARAPAPPGAVLVSMDEGQPASGAAEIGPDEAAPLSRVRGRPPRSPGRAPKPGAMMRTPERARARKGPHGRLPGAVLVTPTEAGNRKRAHEGEAPAAAPAAAKRPRQEEEEEEEKPGGDAPELGATEWLRDDHFSYVMEQWLPKAPQHVWTACPAQVALLRSGMDATDVHSARDGSLRDLWDADHVRTLILPLNCDPHAGKRVGAGQHWSLLVVRREEVCYI